ncbi:MAG: DUF305 domain-containing protein [Micavibrio aeruginosavorus]|uniref:DUF305 domain-containing protein n=2 Tax=Micavibrio aeruginosavorus TaxID=349221 RepID=A0A2W5FNB7_9BACT|nr:MAG: DUF305 domain-containing protein [Micavibrio aeruginosavorus]
MAVLSFVSMYIFMYSMVNTLEDIYPSFNQFYMAGLMAAPMVLIEVVLMSAMYKDKKLNAVIVAVSILIGVIFFLGIRQQTAISDEQFLKSMIPHHSGAILMCREANITDPEIKTLCQTIMEGQQQEIDQMRAILDREN